MLRPSRLAPYGRAQAALQSLSWLSRTSLLICRRSDWQWADAPSQPRTVSSVGQSVVLITPRSWVRSPYCPGVPFNRPGVCACLCRRCVRPSVRPSTILSSGHFWRSCTSLADQYRTGLAVCWLAASRADGVLERSARPFGPSSPCPAVILSGLQEHESWD